MAQCPCRSFAKDANNSLWLQKEWGLCEQTKNSSDVDQLIDFVRSTYETIAMVNYPFDCDFLMPLPAYPVRYVCQFINENITDSKRLLEVGIQTKKFNFV